MYPYLKTQKKGKKVLFTFLYFLFFLVLNLFFYSFITISLYKLICYESNSLNVLIETFSYNKICNIYYFIEETLLFLIIGTSWTNIIINDFFIVNKEIIYYNIIVNNNINYFFFFIDNCLLSLKNKDWNLLFLNFYIRASNLNWINSISLQKTIILNLNESGLFFFRIYNPSHIHVKLVTLYMIYPNEITLYVNKIQCFCFNIIFLYPLELVDLPVLIYIHPFFLINYNIYIDNIIIYYIIFLN